MSWEALAIVFATLFGPVLAVQTQVWLGKRRAEEDRRRSIFHTLMRTRGAPMSPEHVNALNAIPIEFYGVARITSAHKALITHLNTRQPDNAKAWIDRRIDLEMDLLNKMGDELGYTFDVATLKSEFYMPVGHATIENEQTTIRQAMAKILGGEGGIPIEVKKFPGDPEAQAAFKAVLKSAAARMAKSDESPEDRVSDRSAPAE